MNGIRMFLGDVLVNSDKQIVHSLQSLGNKGKFLTFKQYFTQKRNKHMVEVLLVQSHEYVLQKISAVQIFYLEQSLSSGRLDLQICYQTNTSAYLYLSIVCNMITFLKCQRTLKWNILKWTSLAMPLFFLFFFLFCR